MKLKHKIQKNSKYLFLLAVVILCTVLFIYIYYKKNDLFGLRSSRPSGGPLRGPLRSSGGAEGDRGAAAARGGENIIIPDIIGGLGNQLFVVSAAFVYAKDNNYKLMLDNRKDVISYGKPRETYNDTLFSKIPIYTDDKKNFINMNEHEYAYGPTNTTDQNIFLTGGYYQEAKYFNKYRNELLDLFEPTKDINNKVNELCKINNIFISNDFLVSIHIRLDDEYTPIDSDKRVYDKDEYDTIIKKLQEHLQSNKNTKFIIFSNDIPRTTDIFKSVKIEDSRMIYIQSKDYIELALMAKCNDYIASPSTFNWWGIYLNNNPNKKIFIYWKQDSDYRKDFYKKYEYLKINDIGEAPTSSAGVRRLIN